MTRKAFSLIVLFSLVLITTTGYGAEGLFPANDAILSQSRDLIVKNKNPQKALEMLQSAAGKTPGDFRIWLSIGVAYEALSDFPKAIKAYKQALKIEIIPKILLRVKILGKKLSATDSKEVKELSKEEIEALKLFNQALKDRADGNIDEAFQKFIACVKLDPTYLAENDEGLILSGIRFYSNRVKAKAPEALFYLSLYNFFGGYTDAAIDGFKQFIAENPGSKLLKEAQDRLKTLEEMKSRLQTLQVVAGPKNGSGTPKLNPAVASDARTAWQNIKPPTATDSTPPTEVPPVETVNAGPEEPSIFDQFKGKTAEDLFKEAQNLKANDLDLAVGLMEISSQKDYNPENLLALGDSYLEQEKKGYPNSRKYAIQTWQRVVSREPKSEIGKEAAQRVRALQPSAEQRRQEVEEHFEKYGFPADRPGNQK